MPTFSLRGGTKRITAPYALTGRVVHTGEAHPVNYEMLGWNGEEFTGTEVEAPNLEFMVPKLIPTSQVTFQLVDTLASLVGSVNDGPFYGLAKGECLYLGPEQSYKTVNIGKDSEGNSQYQQFVELQHHFKCQPNLSQFRIGDCDPVDIPGWDYVDVYYKKKLYEITPGGEKVEIAVPIQVDVWQVRPYADFSLLNL